MANPEFTASGRLRRPVSCSNEQKLYILGKILDRSHCALRGSQSFQRFFSLKPFSSILSYR